MKIFFFFLQGIKALDYRWGATPVEEKNIETLRVILNSNAAMCSLKTNNLNDAVKFCNTVNYQKSFIINIYI